MTDRVCAGCGYGDRVSADHWEEVEGDFWHRSCLYTKWSRDNEGLNKWMSALDFVYTTLCDLESLIAERDRREAKPVTEEMKQEARLLNRAIESCKYLKQPEFDMRFGRGSPYPENGWQCPKCDWSNSVALSFCRHCDTMRP